MRTETTNAGRTERPTLPPHTDRSLALAAGSRSRTTPHATTPTLRRCRRCGHVLPPRRRRYCSGRCAQALHLAQTREWKRRFREQHGVWPCSPSHCWSIEKRREKGREYTARWRARKRQQAVTELRVRRPA